MALLDMSRDSDAQGREALHVAGEVDLASAPELLAEGTAWVRSRTTAAVRLDLAGVTFIDSTGVSALLQIRRAAAEAGRRLELVDRSPAVDKVLTLAGVAALLGTEGV